MTPCSGLGAQGIWQPITPPQFLQIPGIDGGPNDTPLSGAIVVNPSESAVYTSGFSWNGRGTGLLKSSDCGATWAKVSTGRNGKALESGALWALLVDPSHPEVMYVANGYGSPPSLFKSTNGGVDWDDLFPPGSEANTAVEQGSFTQAIALDPADPAHLVVSFHANCKAPYDPMCLAESTDGGGTWRLFKGPPDAKGWGEASSVTVLGKTSWIYASPDAWGAFYTGDSGKTWTKVVTGPVYGNYSGSTYLAPDGSLFLGVGNTGIYRSQADGTHALGESWSLLPMSPQATTVAGDGTNLYASWGPDVGGQPFYTASLSAPGSWTKMSTVVVGRGSGGFAYDPAHHTMYSANDAFGIWRMSTR